MKIGIPKEIKTNESRVHQPRSDATHLRQRSDWLAGGSNRLDGILFAVCTAGTARNGITIKSGAVEWVEFIDTSMTLEKNDTQTVGGSTAQNLARHTLLC